MEADPKGYAWRHRRKELMEALQGDLPTPAKKNFVCKGCRRNTPVHTLKDRQCLACQVAAWLASA